MSRHLHFAPLYQILKKKEDLLSTACWSFIFRPFLHYCFSYNHQLPPPVQAYLILKVTFLLLSHTDGVRHWFTVWYSLNDDSFVQGPTNSCTTGALTALWRH